MRKILLFIFIVPTFFFLGYNCSYSQKENSNWCFGNHLLMTFNTPDGTPKIDTTSAISAVEGCASISDKNGNLLFYTDGYTVWNREHKIMQNGSGLDGNRASTESAMIIPFPDCDSLYYIFTTNFISQTTGPFDFAYSIVNIRSNGGLGAVTTKNVILNTNSCQKLTAVRHKDCSSFWVIIHTINTDEYLAYLVDKTGISTTPVISHVGQVVQNSSPNFETKGYLKASPLGNKIANAFATDGFVDVYDFDNSTGVLSNRIPLVNCGSTTIYWGAYGVEFSPDGSKLYFAIDLNVSGHLTCLSQFDLNAGDSLAIANSGVQLASTTIMFGAFQLAPNGKIYIINMNNDSLDVIENPNAKGLSCGFRPNIIQLPRDNDGRGLPNMYSGFLSFGYLAPDSISICEGENVMLTIETFGNGNLTNINWNGPQGYRSTDLSTEIYSIKKSQEGIYNLKAYVSGVQCLDSIDIKVKVNVITLPKAEILHDKDVFCEGDTIHLVAYPNGSEYKYKWSTGETKSEIVIKNDDNYDLTVTDTLGCSGTSSVHIKMLAKPIAAITTSGPTTMLDGDTLVLTAHPAISSYGYFWSTGDTTITLRVTKSGTYSVVIENQNGCKDSASVKVTFLTNDINVKIIGPQYLCKGDTTILYADPFADFLTYRWSTGETTDTIKITHGGTFWVKVSKSDKTDSTSFNVTEAEKPKLAILADGPTKFCDGDSVELKAEAISAFFKWQNYYTENFDTKKSFPEWSTTVTNKDWQNPIKTDTNAVPHKKFLGIFGNQALTLTLRNIPIHDSAEVSFNIYIIGTWDGNKTGKNGPDIFKVEELTDKELQYQTTFSLVSNSYQAFPDSFPTGYYPPKTGSKEDFILTTSTVYGECTIYHLDFPFIHKSDSIKIRLTAQLKDEVPNFANESWAIDDFQLKIRTMIDDTVNLKYQWTSGDTTKAVTVSTSGIYKCVATNNAGCTDSASIPITVYPKPKVNIIGSHIVCPYDSIMLTIDENYPSHFWSTGEKTDSIYVSQPGNYNVIVTDSNGCSSQAFYNVGSTQFKSVKIISDSLFCDNTSHLLSANDDFLSYRWSTGDTTKNIYVKSAGTYTLTAVDSNGCVSKDKFTLIDYQLKLSRPAEYDFDKYPVGYTGTTVFQIRSTDTTISDLSIADIYLIGSSGNTFSISSSQQPPFILLKKDNFELTVNFSPKLKGIFYDTIVIKINKPCNWDVTIPIKGLGTVGDTFNMYVWLPDTNALIGTQNFSIPLKATINTQTKFKNLSFDAEIAFKSDYFYPESLLGADSTGNSVVGSDRIYQLSGIIPSIGRDTVTLGILNGLILLGEYSTTPLKINNFEVNDTNILVTKINGSLSVKGVCQQDLSQIRSFTPTSLIISPNPAGNSAEIQLKSEEKGKFVFSIYTLEGEKIKATEFYSNPDAKEYSVSLSLAGLNSGVYELVATTPEKIIKKIIVIMK